MFNSERKDNYAYLFRRSIERNKIAGFINPLWNILPEDIVDDHEHRKKSRARKSKKRSRSSVTQQNSVPVISSEVKSENHEKERLLPDAKTDERVESEDLKYGRALRPGEGSAIASFVQQNARIPRRGEIGWSNDEISKLENLGYVMSGARHSKMNAIRQRKEAQVKSAEDKRNELLNRIKESKDKEEQAIQSLRNLIKK